MSSLFHVEIRILCETQNDACMLDSRCIVSRSWITCSMKRQTVISLSLILLGNLTASYGIAVTYVEACSSVIISQAFNKRCKTVGNEGKVS